MTSHLNQSDKECSVLNRQMQESLGAVKHWEDQAQQFHGEGQRLASDLVALTRENQILNGELRDCAAARDQYRAELSECERQLNQLNELIRSKDDEKQEVLINYRKLIADFERLDLAHRSHSEEGNHLKMELVSRDKKLLSLERQMDEMNREGNQLQIDNAAHSKQQSNLSRTLATAERQIKQLEADKLRLSREIQASRELVHSVDRGKETIQSNFKQLSIEHDRLGFELEKKGTEMSALESRLKTEMLKADRFQELLNTERERQAQIQKSGMDLKQSQIQTEHQLKTLSDQQEMNLSLTKGQLEGARLDLKAATDRISQLEVVVSRKETGLSLSF
jgi:chromosome segregation ATPase